MDQNQKVEATKLSSLTHQPLKNNGLFCKSMTLASPNVALGVNELNSCDYFDEDDDFDLDLCDTQNTDIDVDREDSSPQKEKKSATEVFLVDTKDGVKVKSEHHVTKNSTFCKDAENKQYSGIREVKNDIKTSTTSDKEGNDESTEINQTKESKMVPIDEDLEDYEDEIDELNISHDDINGGETSVYISSEDDSQEFIQRKLEESFESENEVAKRASVFSPGVSFLVKESLTRQVGLKDKSNVISKKSCDENASKEKIVINDCNDDGDEGCTKSARHKYNVKSELPRNRKRSYSSNLTSDREHVDSSASVYDDLSYYDTTSKSDSETSPAKKSRTTTTDSVVLVNEQRSQQNSQAKTSKEDLQIDIDRVLEMFPDLEEDVVRRRFRLLKSQYQDNIIERVIENIVNETCQKNEVINISSSSSGNEYDVDVQTAIGNPRIDIQTKEDKRLDSVHPLLCKKGSNSGKGTKGKGPARKKKHRVEKDSLNFDRGHDILMDGDSWKDIEEGEVEESFSLSRDQLSVMKCDSCKKTKDAEKVVQCCNGHLVCNQCVEEEVKIILKLENQQMQFTCPLKDCDSHVPDSQTKRVLPTLIIGLLQEKFDKQAVASISKMENLHYCPFCNIPVSVDGNLKEFLCLNKDCGMSSCRFCKKSWLGMSHKECGTYTPYAEDTNELELPSRWHPMPTDVEKDFITVALKQDSREYIHVASLFSQSMNGAIITSIRRVQNPKLWQKFKLTRKHMTEDIGRLDLNEKQLFHGTNISAMESICRDGLDWRMCGENGTSFGQGTYFAKSAAYSNGYCQVYLDKNMLHNPLPRNRFGFHNSSLKGLKSACHMQTNVQTASHFDLNLNKTPAFSFASPVTNTTSIGGAPLVGFDGNNPNGNVTGVLFGGSKNPFHVNTDPSFGNGVNSSQQSGFGTITYGTTFGEDPKEDENKIVPEVSSKIEEVLQIRHKYMFVARVLVGRATNGHYGLRKPPCDPNDTKGRTFNSCVNNIKKPTIFVVFDSSQCYPEYLLEYKA